jgi:glycine cleavage system transcriptional repressor
MDLWDKECVRREDPLGDQKDNETNTASRYVLSVMCEDKVGLVARITGAVGDLGGNIEELRQGVVQGYFVFTMIAAFPPDTTSHAVRSSLESLDGLGDFVVGILPQRQDVPPAAVGGTFVLTITGQDSPKILTKITSYLADRRINIEDLTSRSTEGRFVIIAQVTIPESTDIRSTRLDLAEILVENQVTVSLMHEDIFAATNRITMRPPKGKTFP